MSNSVNDSDDGAGGDHENREKLSKLSLFPSKVIYVSWLFSILLLILKYFKICLLSDLETFLGVDFLVPIRATHKGVLTFRAVCPSLDC